MAWFESLWIQVFREERWIEPGKYLYTNLLVGLFAMIALVSGHKAPERTHWAFEALVAVTVVTHLGGPVVVALVRNALAPTIFVQGVSLFASTCALTAISTWYCWHTTILTNFSYLPGVVLSLLLQASLEIHFFGPRAVRALHVRGIGLSVGALCELSLAVALVRYFLR